MSAPAPPKQAAVLTLAAVRADIQRTEFDVAGLAAMEHYLRSTVARPSAELFAQVAGHQAEHQRLLDMAAAGQHQGSPACDPAARLQAALPCVESAAAALAKAIAVLQNTEAVLAARQGELERLRIEEVSLASPTRGAYPGTSRRALH